MSKKFDRADTDARGLRGAYRELGMMLSDEAVDLRAEIHEQFYPVFGFVVGQQRRFIQRRSRQWDELFRDLAQRLFHYSAEVEEKLVYSLAVERQGELQEVLERLRKRKSEADQLIRAISWRMRQYMAGEELDTESVYDFCLQVEQAAQFFQFTSLVLLQPRARTSQITDPQFKDLDWDELEQIGASLPLMIRGGVVAAPVQAPPQPAPPPPPPPQRARPPPPPPPPSPPASTPLPPPPPRATEPAKSSEPAEPVTIDAKPAAPLIPPKAPSVPSPPPPPPPAPAAQPAESLTRPRPAAPPRDEEAESLTRPSRPPRVPRG